jgi:TRAP-type uncharacterized transport system substrate-binding protein
MSTVRVGAISLFALFCLTFSIPIALGQPPKATAGTKAAANSTNYEEKKRETNDIALSIVVSGLSCTCARFAEDIRNVVNDLRPGGVRVLPVLGVGGLQNLNDVLFLRGIDMGVVDEDNLRLLKKRDPLLYANIEERVQYITKLYNSEFHVLARADINSYDDLRGKKVNFNLKDSQTEVTADIIFGGLKIDVQRSYYDNDEAIKRLKGGDLAAMIILTGAPQAALAKLSADDQIHFLALDQETLPNFDLRPIFSDYLPAQLTHEQYPNLIDEGSSVSTIANRALLVAYAWPDDSPRQQRLAKFVREFFGKIDQFHDGARHPKWDEINLAAEIPGWTRFKPAADWLAEHKSIFAAQHQDIGGRAPSADLKVAFDRFLENYASSSGRKALSAREREALFSQFQQYLGPRKAEQPPGGKGP